MAINTCIRTIEAHCDTNHELSSDTSVYAAVNGLSLKKFSPMVTTEADPETLERGGGKKHEI